MRTDPHGGCSVDDMDEADRVFAAPGGRGVADAPAERAGSVLERALRREGVLVLAGLFALCGLAWGYLANGAGLGMSAWDMTTFALFPHLVGDMPAGSPEMAWSPVVWALIVAMWWAMMVAMMTPSVAPTVLLYARVHRNAAAQARAARRTIAPAWWFATGYGLAWLVFSVAAAGLQFVLERSGLVSMMAMGSQARWLSASVLVAAGLYQLSPLKQACLSHCRAPASFLSRHWRPHVRGAVRLGMLHGAYCVGCCWMLMALLFVGGVMNVAWIAALSVLVLAEKVAGVGRWIGWVAGGVLVLWGVATLLV